MINLSYVLPLRWSDDSGLGELVDYLRALGPEVREVIVVDGSAELLFDRHAEALSGVARHFAPDPSRHFKMGKVDGVTTGILAARCERAVIADDDVRYDVAGLHRIAALLESAELVRPQNYFNPLPWHARLDTARSLLNRVHSGDLEFGSGDFPGTLGLRRSWFLACGGYDGDVMFENLELMRTVKAGGGRVATPLDLYVRRLPPSTGHFISQRIRQAYDDFALPLRMAGFLAVLPSLLIAAVGRRFKAIAAVALALIGLAEFGRRRAGGRAYFRASSALLAPVWVAERALTVWLAVWHRLVGGGIRYGDSLIPRSANSMRSLRRRVGPIPLSGSGSLEPDPLMGAVAEGMKSRSTATAQGHRSAV